MKVSRRGLIAGAALAVAGAVAAREVPQVFGWDRPPLNGGYAAAADKMEAVAGPGVTVRYYVRTTEPLVALTFDDGPAPRWTPMVLDTLEEAGAPATFFMVGRNLQANAALVRDRLGRHEVGNHSWSHDDLATLDLAGVRAELTRTHDTIQQVTGKTPTLMRPPYGHLGGSTLLAADSMGYDVVLWSQQMHERRYQQDPPAQARDIIDGARAGSIILAHDTGKDERLMALKQLKVMIDGIRARGFRLVTVSDLITAAGATTVGSI